MRFVDPALQNALAAWRQNPDHRDRAIADNFWFEERAGDARRAAFETYAGKPADPEALRRSLIQYVRDCMEIPSGIPHTFLSDLTPAFLTAVGVDQNQPIVRLESLQRVFSQWALPATAGPPLERLRSAIDTHDASMVDGFLTIWNNARDFRPAFAAWKDELLAELAAPDWADRLRDRLGLEHYQCENGPIPVALMEYRVLDVVQAATEVGSIGAFTAPTVLDSRPGPYFFPAPRECPYGRVMSLTPMVSDDDLLAEMLHVRITYRRDHIAPLGYITRPPAPHDLRELRNHHLLALQVASGREDFGEEIP